MNEGKKQSRVVIVGGGFGGIAAAKQAAERLHESSVQIQLISDEEHFEFRPGLYEVVAGQPARRACIPLEKMLSPHNVTVVKDRISDVRLGDRSLRGESGEEYSYDYVVLALGSETAYFNIPGLKAHAFGMRTIAEAVELQNHIEKMFRRAADLEKAGADKAEILELLHIVIVGAGASGVELAGQLAAYKQELSDAFGLDSSLVTIDLIEAKDRVTPMLSPAISRHVADRLHHLGVNIFPNRSVTGTSVDELELHGMTMETGTVVWTAGVQVNRLYKEMDGLAYGEKGRVSVRKTLQAEGHENVFVIGDAADTRHAGTAQTAIAHGRTAGANIARLIRGEPTVAHNPRRPVYALPVGPRWAAVDFGLFAVYGGLGWFVRVLADVRYFLSVLPMWDVWRMLRRTQQEICEQCGACAHMQTPPPHGHSEASEGETRQGGEK